MMGVLADIQARGQFTFNFTKGLFYYYSLLTPVCEIHTFPFSLIYALKCIEMPGSLYCHSGDFIQPVGVRVIKEYKY